MPKFPPAASPRLRATHALPLATLILLAVLFGTPGRDDGQVVRAQSPASPARPPAVAAASRRPLQRRSRYPKSFAGSTCRGRPTEAAAAKSAGCITCHQGQHDPHGKPETVRLGCVDCHGGNPQATDQQQAHVWPRFPDAWRSSGNPVRSYTLLNHESPEFIRFVNPGDLRVAHLSCGTTSCHADQVLQVRKSMMTHGSMLWGAALFNNGSVPFKRARYGESYSMNGAPQRLQTVPPADSVRDGAEGSRAVPRPPAPLRGLAARQRPADLRARPPRPAGDRHPQPVRGSRASPAPA